MLLHIRAELGLEVLKDGAGGAGAYLAGVHFNHGDKLGGGAGEPAFVGFVEVVGGEAPLLHGIAVTARHFHHRVAGDAFQRAEVCRRGDDALAARNEDVVGAAFGDEAVQAEHDGLNESGHVRLNERHDVVQVLGRFYLRVQALRVVLARGAYHRDDALLIHLGRVEGYLVGDDDDGRALVAFLGVDAEVAGAARDDRADVCAFVKVVDLQRFQQGFAELLNGDADVNAQEVRAAVEALKVLVKLEDFVAVGADALKHAVAV